MAYKKKSAQEVQETTQQPDPATHEEIATGVYMRKEDIAAAKAANANRPRENGSTPNTDPKAIAADLSARLDEIEIMLQRGSDPERIAAVYRIAAADSRRISELTGDIKYLQYAERLELESDVDSIREFIAKYAPAASTEPAQEVQNDNAIYINIPPVDPKLPPGNPEFDSELWKAAFTATGGIEAARERMEAAQKHLQETILDSMRQMNESGIAGIIAESLYRTTNNVLTSINAFFNSDAYKAVKESWRYLGAFLEDNKELISAAAESIEQLEPLLPFVQEELEQLKQDPEYTDIPLSELMESGIDADGNPTESRWQQLLRRAKERKAAADAEAEREAEKPQLNLQAFASGEEQTEEPAQEVQEDKTKTPAKLTAAEKSGAIISIGNRLFVPSDAEYQNAFVTSVNANTGLFRRISKDGKPDKRELALDIPIPFIQGMAKAVMVDYFSGTRNSKGIEVYFPTFVRELGLDIKHRPTEKGEQAQEVQEETAITKAAARENFAMQTIYDLETIWGKLPNDETEYRLITARAYNPETETLYYDSPYLRQLIGAMANKEEKKLTSGAKYYNWQCDLLHATAANERNPAAVEMATRLLVGVQQRGMRPDCKLAKNKNRRYADDEQTLVSWEITCAGLIEECPQIRERLKAQKNTSAKTMTLNRAFKAMYRILHSKTDLFKYYTDVKITEIIPSMKTINDRIIISHHGGNPKYKRPYLPLIDEPQQEQPEEQQEQPEV